MQIDDDTGPIAAANADTTGIDASSGATTAAGDADDSDAGAGRRSEPYLK